MSAVGDARKRLAEIAAEQTDAVGTAADGLAVAERLLRQVVDYWDGRPLTHHGDHIYADMCDVLRAITPANSCGTCSGRGIWMDEPCRDCRPSGRPIDQEFAVVVGALLAGRIDGQQAIASLTAIHERSC